MRYGLRWVVIALAMMGWLSTAGWTQTDRSDPRRLAKAVEAIENLDALRSGLAGTFKGKDAPADKSTFKEVCKPVGMQAKQIAQDNGWKVIQMADKYRNPKHQLDPEGRQAYNQLEANASLMGLWMRTTFDGAPGARYFRRITVKSACLACHGAKARRPAFVQQGYPDDRAYDFQAGDLRGIYSVFIPEGQ